MESVVTDTDCTRSARVLLDAGIVEYQARDKSAAQILFGLAATLFHSAGDTWNESIARQWQKSAK